RSIGEMLSFIELCRSHNVKVFAVKNHMDINGQWADVILTVLGICAKIEKEMIVARLKGGLRDKMKKEGWRPGGSPEGWFSAKFLKKVDALISMRKDGKSINYM